MSLLLFLKSSYTPPLGGIILADTESARRRRNREKTLQKEEREARRKVREAVAKLKRQKRLVESAAVPFVIEAPILDAVPFDLKEYAEDFIRAITLQPRKVRDLWLFIALMFGDEDDT